MRKKMKKLVDVLKEYYLFLAVFVTGMSVMIVELVGTRILAPFYGTTIYVWSSLITVVLVFLALGYFLGGRLADKKPQMEILYLLIFVAAISLVLVGKFDTRILELTNTMGTRTGALVSAFVLFFMPFTLFGMVIPYVIKGRVRKLNKVGTTSGSIYTVSTLGSLVGTIGTGFVLIPNLSISVILYLVSSLLGIIAVGGIVLEKKYRWLFFVVLFIPLFFIPVSSVSLREVVKVSYQGGSLYGQIKVIDVDVPGGDRLRYLLLDGASQTEYDYRRKRFHPYSRLVEKAVDYHGDVERALILGLGGGGLDRMFQERGIKVDNVEISPKMVEVSKEYFDFDGNVIIADARTYVKNTDKKYDLIVGDAYSGYSPQPHLVTKQAFEEMKGRLQDDGVMVLNVVSFIEKDNTAGNSYEQSIYKTLKEVFPYVYFKGLGYGVSNIIFYASDRTLALDDQHIEVDVSFDKETIVLTDDYNPVETIALANLEAWRESNMKIFAPSVLYRE